MRAALLILKARVSRKTSQPSCVVRRVQVIQKLGDGEVDLHRDQGDPDRNLRPALGKELDGILSGEQTQREHPRKPRVQQQQPAEGQRRKLLPARRGAEVSTQVLETRARSPFP